MYKKIKKVLSAVVALTMVCSLASCGGQNNDIKKGSEVKVSADGVYPVECEDTLTIWCGLNATLSSSVTNFAETAIAKELQKRTGVKVEYIHPAIGQETEQFNLMIASGELPDIICYSWYDFGAQSAIDNGYILELNDIIDKWAPNLKQMLSENEEYDKMIKTDEGSYYVFPFLRESSLDCIYSGPIVRQDWLDKLGLEQPETIDDWENMLRKFKDELGVETPFATGGVYKNGTASGVNALHAIFAGAYGVDSGLYLNDEGKVAYGPNEDEWKDYLAKMNEWYNEGLIDRNIATVDGSGFKAKVLNDKVGATFGSAAGNLGAWMNAKKQDDSTFKLSGVSYAVSEKGEEPQFAEVESPYNDLYSYAITTSCKNPELAARFLDYGYSEEGRMLYNFGTEGVSYEMDGDYPKFTELITEDEKGISTALMNYAMGSTSGPFMQDGRVVEQMQSSPKESREAVLVWADNNALKHKIPKVTFTTDEQTEISNITSEIDTYTAEMTIKFINGTESLDKFDDYRSELKKFGLDRLIEIYETAVERYNDR